MSSTPYRRGYAFELAVKRYFESNDAYVIRSSGSHGLYDLIAIKYGAVYGVQCRKDGRIRTIDKKIMLEQYDKHGIIPVLAYRDKRKLKLIDLRSNEPLENV